ncbi:unnamed protein product [Colias eurytheme]|nr:unnamed protein product [Colias eurytheme]
METCFDDSLLEQHLSSLEEMFTDFDRWVEKFDRYIKKRSTYFKTEIDRKKRGKPGTVKTQRLFTFRLYLLWFIN